MSGIRSAAIRRAAGTGTAVVGMLAAGTDGAAGATGAGAGTRPVASAEPAGMPGATWGFGVVAKRLPAGRSPTSDVSGTPDVSDGRKRPAPARSLAAGAANRFPAGRDEAGSSPCFLVEKCDPLGTIRMRSAGIEPSSPENAEAGCLPSEVCLPFAAMRFSPFVASGTDARGGPAPCMQRDRRPGRVCPASPAVPTMLWKTPPKRVFRR